MWLPACRGQSNARVISIMLCMEMVQDSRGAQAMPHDVADANRACVKHLGMACLHLYSVVGILKM